MLRESDCEAIESLIREGKAARARAILEQTGRAEIPRALYARVAGLARRAGHFHYGIRLLAKVIRLERDLTDAASPAELAEYALLLIKIGAVEEGRALLTSVDPAKEPLAPFYLALSFFPEWNYASAIPLLEDFIRRSDATGYQTLVAKVNLTAAYLHTDSSKGGQRAEPLLRETLAITEARGLRLLNANLLELSAQFHLGRREYREAIECLNGSAAILSESGLFDELFVRKWLALVESYRVPSLAESLLGPVREEARKMKHWETLRDLDFHNAKIQRDVKLYHHLFFGTPHRAFREHLRSALAGLPEPGIGYDWQLGSGGTFDVAKSEWNGELTTLKTGQFMQKAFLELSSDFYRPVRVATLAARLFVGQYYDHATMPNRVQQIVKRARRWLEGAKIPLTIEEHDGAYRLAGDVILRVALDEKAGPTVVPSSSRLKLAELQEAISTSDFSLKEAATRLSCSARTALRIVNAGVEHGLLEKYGAASRSRYRFRGKIAG